MTTHTTKESQARSKNPNALRGYHRPVRVDSLTSDHSRLRKPRPRWGLLMLVVLVGAWVGIGVGVIAAEWQGVQRSLRDALYGARSRTIDAAKRSHIIREGER